MTANWWKGLADMGFLGGCDPGSIRRRRRGASRTLRDRRGDGPRAGAGAVSSTVYLAAEAILLAGSEAQKAGNGFPCTRRAQAVRHRWRCSKAGASVATAIKLTAPAAASMA